METKKFADKLKHIGHRSQNSNSFNFYFCIVVQEAFDLDQDHRRKMFAHVFSIPFSNCPDPLLIFVFSRDVDHKSADVGCGPSCSSHNSKDIGQRSIKLFDKILADDVMVLVPRYLTSNKQ